MHAQKQNYDFEKLNSLVGTWRMETAKGVLYESWQKINDSTLRGYSYKINGKDSILLEQMDLIQKGAIIQYVPLVKDQNNNEAVIFTLSKAEGGIYTFENPSHDFPQKIVYTLPRNNVLLAWIEGKVSGKFKKSEYRYTKLL